MGNKNIVKKIIDDVAESTRTVHQINKENIAAVKYPYISFLFASFTEKISQFSK